MVENIVHIIIKDLYSIHKSYVHNMIIEISRQHVYSIWYFIVNNANAIEQGEPPI